MGFEQLNYNADKNDKLYEEVSFLLKENNPTYKDSIVLRYATKIEDYKTIKLLIEDKRVDILAEDNYCIKVTALNNNKLIMKYLLENTNASPTASDNYPLYIAIEKHNNEILKLLIEDSRVNLKIDDNYPLYLSIIVGNLEAFELIRKELNIRYEDIPEKVILKAIERKELKIVNHILKSSNKPTIKMEEIEKVNIQNLKLNQKTEEQKEENMILEDINLIRPKKKSSLFGKVTDKLTKYF